MFRLGDGASHRLIFAILMKKDEEGKYRLFLALVSVILVDISFRFFLIVLQSRRAKKKDEKGKFRKCDSENGSNVTRRRG